MTQTITPLPQLGQWRSLAELTALQDEQLPRMLAWAARSPFYRARLAAAVPTDRDGLTATPLTGKQDLRDNYPFGMLAVDPAQLATYHESSGTAGKPTPSYYTAEDWTVLALRALAGAWATRRRDGRAVGLPPPKPPRRLAAS